MPSSRLERSRDMTRRRIGLISAFALATGACVAVLVFSPPRLEADIHPYEQLVVDGAMRTYRLVVPRATEHEGVPLVFAFHGIGDSPESMAEYSELDQLASEHQFILVYASARRGTWSMIPLNGVSSNENDDIRFFDLLLDHLTVRVPVDLRRIHVIGMSHGAAFAQLVAANRSRRIAAVIVHSGATPTEAMAAIRSYPIMLIVGTDDSPATIGAVRLSAERYREQGHEVDFLAIDGLGHAWATGQNDRMWEFLSEHSLEIARGNEPKGTDRP